MHKPRLMTSELAQALKQLRHWMLLPFPVHLKQRKEIPREPEGHEDPVPPRVSSSLNEAVAGTSTTLPAMDTRTHQILLMRVART